MKGISIFKSEDFWPVMIAVVVSVFFVVTTVQATTTISTDITTAGTLTVSSGDTSLQHASTTQITNSGISWFTGDVRVNGYATTTASTGAFATLGAIAASSTLQVTGNQTNYGTFTVSGTGATTLGGALDVTGATTVASTTATSFKVGQVGTQLSQVVSGFCVTDATSIAVATSVAGGGMASTTITYRACTPSTAVTLGANSRVFVQATSSLPYWIFIQSASTTPSTGAISVGLVNTSTTTASTAVYSFNFLAVQ